jgi:hypothetical protein
MAVSVIPVPFLSGNNDAFILTHQNKEMAASIAFQFPLKKSVQIILADFVSQLHHRVGQTLRMQSSD